MKTAGGKDIGGQGAAARGPACSHRATSSTHLAGRGGGQVLGSCVRQGEDCVISESRNPQGL